MKIFSLLSLLATLLLPLGCTGGEEPSGTQSSGDSWSSSSSGSGSSSGSSSGSPPLQADCLTEVILCETAATEKSLACRDMCPAAEECAYVTCRVQCDADLEHAKAKCWAQFEQCSNEWPVIGTVHECVAAEYEDAVECLYGCVTGSPSIEECMENLTEGSKACYV